MKKSIVFGIALLIIVLLSSCEAPQNVQSQSTSQQFIYITASGYGINQEDALNDAKLKALEQGVGEYISGKTLVVNYHLVNKTILKKVNGVIVGYKILNTVQYNEDTIKLTARFKVSPQLVDQAYWEIIREMKKPRVAIIIPERIGNKNVSDPVGQAEIIKTFLKYDFRVVDKSVVNQMKIREEAQLALQGNTNSIKKLQQELGVDILVIGKGTTQSGGNVMGMETASANLNARVVWLSSGEIVYEDNIRSASPGLNFDDASKLALRKAGDALGEILVKNILNKWINDLANGRTITVLFTGVKNYQDAQEIKNELLQKVGAIDVLERSYQKGVLRCDVIFNGDSQLLAQKILKYLGKRNPKIVSSEMLHLVISIKYTF